MLHLDGEEKTAMAESEVKFKFGSAQVVVPTCEKHNEQCNNFFCSDCDEFICIECAKSYHCQHDWNTVQNVSRQKMSRFSRTTRSQEIKDKHIPKLEGELEKIDSVMQQNREHRDSEIVKLKTHFKNIVSHLTKAVEDQTKNLQRGFETKNIKLNEMRKKCQDKISTLHEMMDELKESKSLSDINLLNINCTLNKALSNSNEDNIDACEYSMHFKEGSIDEATVVSLLGTVKDYDDISLTKINSFRHEKCDIIALEVDIYGNAVLVTSNQTYYDRISIKGKLRSTNEIQCDINDFTMLSNDDIIFSDSETNAIKWISNDKITTVVETSPLTPEGVCITNTGHILVTMADPSADDQNSKGLVKMFSMQGEVRRVYEYQNSGNRLFTLPFRIAQNRNTDICVLDSISPEQGILHVISTEGKTRFYYEGSGDLEHPLLAADIVCDSECNVLVMDAKNHFIHLLDSSGFFIKYLRTQHEERRASLSLALRDDILWAGGHNGFISVYKYSNKS